MHPLSTGYGSKRQSGHWPRVRNPSSTLRFLWDMRASIISTEDSEMRSVFLRRNIGNKRKTVQYDKKYCHIARFLLFYSCAMDSISRLLNSAAVLYPMRFCRLFMAATSMTTERFRPGETGIGNARFQNNFCRYFQD